MHHIKGFHPKTLTIAIKGTLGLHLSLMFMLRLPLENEMLAAGLGIGEKNNVGCGSQYSRTSSLQ